LDGLDALKALLGPTAERARFTSEGGIMAGADSLQQGSLVDAGGVVYRAGP